jgi:LmeA-like phospholipid-binding
MRRLVVVLIVLLALLAVVDRVGVLVAQSVLASQVKDQLELDQTPDVSIRGIPFLTQAVRGDYGDVRVRLPDVDAGAVQNIAIDARLQGVRVPLSAAIHRRIDQVPVDRISGTLTVRYDELARASGISGLTIVRDGDSLKLAGSVRVLGRQVAASAVGRVEVRGSDIAINAEQAQVAGIPVPQVALDAAARLLSFKVSPTNLPLSLRITSVDIGDDALFVSAVSDDVVLRPDDVQVN